MNTILSRSRYNKYDYVDKVYTPETIADTDIYETTMDAIEDEDIEITKAKGGTSIIDTASLAFEFLGLIQYIILC